MIKNKSLNGLVLNILWSNISIHIYEHNTWVTILRIPGILSQYRVENACIVCARIKKAGHKKPGTHVTCKIKILGQEINGLKYA